MKFLNKSAAIGFVLGAIIGPVVLVGGLYLFVKSQIGDLEETGYPPPEIPYNETVSLDWSVRTLDGTALNLQRQLKDKVIFLNFWATWCPPCVGEMPSIEKLHEHFKDRVAFVCVSREDVDTIKAFQLKNDYSFPLYQITEELPDEFKTRSIPATFIISKNRKIHIRHRGGADWSHADVIDYLETMLHL